jgi:hypothetical protein
MNAGIRKGRKRRDPLANILNTDQGIWSGKNIVEEMLRAVRVGWILGRSSLEEPLKRRPQTM